MEFIVYLTKQFCEKRLFQYPKKTRYEIIKTTNISNLKTGVGLDDRVVTL